MAMAWRLADMIQGTASGNEGRAADPRAVSSQ
jgi:hypothetical protein